MAQFRAVISNGRTETTRLGHKSTGIRAEAQSYQGKVVTRLFHNEADDVDMAVVELRTHPTGNFVKTLYEGPVRGN